VLHTTFTPELADTGATLAPVPAPDRDYADWYEIGEAWVRANSTPRSDYAIRELVHGWMRIHCPPALLAEHRALEKSYRDAEFGAAPFKLGQYGLQRVAS
jgi:hypothetical protein